MKAERILLETDQEGCLKHLPTLPPNARIEAIFLIEEPSDQLGSRKRRPSPKIAQAGKILGDIIQASELNDWDVLK